MTGMALRTRHHDVGYVLLPPMFAQSVRHAVPGGVDPMEIVENEKMEKEKERMVRMEVEMLGKEKHGKEVKEKTVEKMEKENGRVLR